MRSRSMHALTVDIQAAYPGVVIYGIGDAAHKLRASDHNEDDTTGSRPAQSDSDSNPEHRAIDVMLGPAISRAQMQALVERVVAGEIARERAGGKPRLFYVIFDGWLYSRTYGWVKQPKTDDPHREHAHFSGRASGDEIAEPWPAVTEGDDMAIDPEMVVTMAHRVDALIYDRPLVSGGPYNGERNEQHHARKALEAKIDALAAGIAELKARPPVVVDPAMLEAALRKVIGSVDGATPAS